VDSVSFSISPGNLQGKILSKHQKRDVETLGLGGDILRDLNKLLTCFSVLLVCAVPVVPFAAENAGMENTYVTPHMEVPIEPGRNIVFCSTFQIAWNDMKNGIIKDNIYLEKPLDLVRFLNRGLSTKADISDQDYLAVVGYGQDDIAGKINRALRRKFGSNVPAVDDKFNEADVILAYAFLIKELQFQNAFEDFEDPIIFHGRDNHAPVEAFGIFKYSEVRHDKLRDQVEIIDYKNPQDFIASLKSNHPDDEIILANIAPEKTLLETFEKVNWRIARSRRYAESEPLGENDILQIPKFDLSIDHTYSSLLDLHLLNTRFERYFVCEAKQDIRFTLDHCGATVKSQAIFAVKKGPPVDFKILIFNNPFMLYLKKKDGKYPYLALWVENAELLIESE
jgi:hypothetical protein